MKLGILGGTFDPIHLGHLGIANEVLGAFELDSILLIPAGRPWLKSGRPISKSADRLAMAGLAVEDNPRLTVSNIEIDREGSSFTVDTLEELHIIYGVDLFVSLIIGMDSLNELPLWVKPDRVFELATVIVVSRPGFSSPDLRELEKVAPNYQEGINFFNGPQSEISATDIRRRVAKGCNIEGWVPVRVKNYIQENGLYQKKEFNERREET